MRDDLDRFRTEPANDHAADAIEQRIAGGDDADVVLVREFGDLIEQRGETAFDEEPLTFELREELELTLATDQYFCRHYGVHGTRGEAFAAVVADADHRDCASRLHAFTSVESSRSAWMMATAMVLPPLRPRVMM